MSKLDALRTDGSSDLPELALLTGHTAPVISAAFSPDGKLLATTSWDSRIVVWETETGEIRDLWERQHVPHWVAFSPEGELVVGSTRGLDLCVITT